MGEASHLSTAAMNPRVDRQQYLATYSQADESVFHSRKFWENFRGRV